MFSLVILFFIIVFLYVVKFYFDAKHLVFNKQNKILLIAKIIFYGPIFIIILIYFNLKIFFLTTITLIKQCLKINSNSIGAIIEFVYPSEKIFHKTSEYFLQYEIINELCDKYKTNFYLVEDIYLIAKVLSYFRNTPLIFNEEKFLEYFYDSCFCENLEVKKWLLKVRENDELSNFI